MSQRSDCKNAVLATLAAQAGQTDDLEDIFHGGPQDNDGWLAYFQSKGATSGEYNDAAYEWLVAEGVTPAALPDMWYEMWCIMGGPGGGSTPVFHAATFNPTTKQLVMQLVGTGTPTVTHTATEYAQDQDSNWQSYGANKPVWVGGRYVDEDNVFADVTGGGALIDPQPYLQYYPPQTNILLNSNVVGTETPTVAIGPVSIVVYVDGVDVASAIVTAGTATATGYATATPGSPVELDVTVGGTITVELTGTPFAVNVTEKSLSLAEYNGPIITVAAPVATDALVYSFDLANMNTNEYALYAEVETSFQSNPADGLGRTSTPLSTDFGDFQMQLNSGTGGGDFGQYRMNGVSGATPSLSSLTIPINTLIKLGNTWSATAVMAEINYRGTGTAEAAFTGYDTAQGKISLFSVAGTDLISCKIREIQGYDITSYAEGKTIIDDLML